MKKGKIIQYLLISLLLAGCTNVKLKRAEEKANDYIEQITTLTERLTKLSEEKEELLEKVEKCEPEIIEEGECAFTRTYHVVDIMKYQATDNISKFVILDQFQEYNPFIVKLTKDQASKLFKNKMYEFTFNGSRKYKNKEYNELFENFELTNIKETEKVGLDQLQETCR